MEIVRQRFRLRESRRRRWDERLYVRFPGIAYALTRGVMRLRPRSLVRRALLRHQWRRALEAANRGDWEAAFAPVPPRYESFTPPDLAGLGFEPVYRGPDGRLRYQLTWIEQLGDFHQETEELIDLGDRMVLLAHMKGTGLGSGAEFKSELGYLITISDGQLIREESFRSHAETLEAAGLRE